MKMEEVGTTHGNLLRILQTFLSLESLILGQGIGGQTLVMFESHQEVDLDHPLKHGDLIKVRKIVDREA